VGRDGEYRLDGREGRASIVQVEPGVFSVLLEGRSYEVRSHNGTMFVDGDRFEVEIDDPRAGVRRGLSAGAHGEQPVKAAMPGKVVRVLVAEGDEVSAGQGIAVVEAMKMQNEVKSPREGRILSVAVKEGAAVSAGDLLALVG
jgi:biotin carboxyl carrier protein